mmetsp:Transcript_19087/g.53179  ORF Transcript_19087/g.53179 Transcript_19087/m.53179 type:complete len:90 (-) Transcript_19087:1014-1283(-)
MSMPPGVKCAMGRVRQSPMAILQNQFLVHMAICFLEYCLKQWIGYFFVENTDSVARIPINNEWPLVFLLMHVSHDIDFISTFASRRVRT